MVSQDKPILDTLNRTMDNLSIIDELYKKEGRGWEITQLINSFAGVVAYPWEKWNKKLSEIHLGTPEAQDWPEIPAEDPRDEQPKTVGALVRLVRNAFAHGNLNLHVDAASDQINALTIWNTHPDSGLRTWGATVDTKTLECFLKAMSKTVSSFPEPSQKTIPAHHAERPGIDKPLCVACGQKVKPGNHRYDTWLISQQKQTVRSD